MPRTLATLLAGALLFAPALVLAQRGQGGGPLHYNAAAEVTVMGSIDDVKSMPAAARGSRGLHLMLRIPDTGVTEVALGPAWFVTSNHFELAKGDNVTVTGSKTTMNGRDVLIARELKKADKVLRLRDTNGFPLWSRGARGSKS